MPKTRPQDGDINWGVMLNDHLAQTLSENGGINTSDTDPTLASDDAGYTFINTTTNELKKWDGNSWDVLIEKINSLDAQNVNFDNTDSTLSSENIQDALEEIKSTVTTIETHDRNPTNSDVRDTHTLWYNEVSGNYFLAKRKNTALIEDVTQNIISDNGILLNSGDFYEYNFDDQLSDVIVSGSPNSSANLLSIKVRTTQNQSFNGIEAFIVPISNSPGDTSGSIADSFGFISGGSQTDTDTEITFSNPVTIPGNPSELKLILVAFDTLEIKTQNINGVDYPGIGFTYKYLDQFNSEPTWGKIITRNIEQINQTSTINIYVDNTNGSNDSPDPTDEDLPYKTISKALDFVTETYNLINSNSTVNILVKGSSYNLEDDDNVWDVSNYSERFRVNIKSYDDSSAQGYIAATASSNHPLAIINGCYSDFYIRNINFPEEVHFTGGGNIFVNYCYFTREIEAYKLKRLSFSDSSVPLQRLSDIVEYQMSSESRGPIFMNKCDSFSAINVEWNRSGSLYTVQVRSCGFVNIGGVIGEDICEYNSRNSTMFNFDNCSNIQINNIEFNNPNNRYRLPRLFEFFNCSNISTKNSITLSTTNNQVLDWNISDTPLKDSALFYLQDSYISDFEVTNGSNPGNPLFNSQTAEQYGIILKNSQFDSESFSENVIGSDLLGGGYVDLVQRDLSSRFINIDYDNTSSGLTSQNKQGAIDELKSGSFEVLNGSGAPTATEPLGRLYFDSTADQIYVSKGGGTWVSI